MPYLLSFVNFEIKAHPESKDFIHGYIPHFEVALKGIESGYRQYFRSLPSEHLQYHALCETYELLCIDVVGGQSLNEIINEIKTGKGEYEIEYKSSVYVRGNKSEARDTAFKLLQLIFLGKFED